jgi:hypothetical protein
MSERIACLRQDAGREFAISSTEGYEISSRYTAGTTIDYEIGFLELSHWAYVEWVDRRYPIELLASKSDGGWQIDLLNGKPNDLKNARVFFRGYVFHIGEVKSNGGVRLTIAPVDGGQGYEDAMVAADSADAVFSLIRRIEKRRFGQGNAQRNIEAALGLTANGGAQSDYERVSELTCGYELLYELAMPGAPYLTAETKDYPGNNELRLEHFGRTVVDAG